jgi:phosphate transport system substrate-binding protein
VTAARALAVLVALAAGVRLDAGAQPVPAESCAPAAPRPAGLILAGSGSNVAVVRAIAGWFRAPDFPPVRVPESIGTGGALRALSDGAIDVGLASRRLTTAEKEAGFVETVLARVPLAVVVHPRVSVADVALRELVAIYRGERDRWPDGTPIVPVLRERGDSGNDLIARAWPDLWDAMDAALRAGRFTTCYTDQELADTIAETDGAVGLLDVGTLRLTHPQLRTLAVDGIPPTPLRAESGSHPLVKTLTFVTLGPPAGDAARFVAFATSPGTTELLAGYGYLHPTSR